MTHFSFAFFIVQLITMAIVDMGEVMAEELQGYSADMIQSTQEGKSAEAKIFRAQGYSRTEYLQAGARIIEIINPQVEKGWLIWPDSGMFAEQVLEPLALKVALTQLSENPCEQLTGYQCKRQGEELLNGRTCSVWEVVGSNAQWREWVDSERRFPVRQLFKSGQSTERVLEKLEQINGRTVELWRTFTSNTDTQTFEMLFWYDPILKTNLREEVPGLMVRELRNIKIGKLNSDLFQVPEGLERMSEQGR
jgi:hypothetical protein